MVAVISVDAYPFFGFLSRDLTCHLEVTGIGKFIISAYRGLRFKGILSCLIHICNNFKAKAT